MKKVSLIVIALVAGLILSVVVFSAGINDQLRAAIENNDIQKVKELLSKGVEVKATGGAALWEATRRGRTEIAKLLIEKGANVNYKEDFGGMSVLMIAASKGRMEIAKLLINKGADVNAKGESGGTPLMYAASAEQTEIAKLLINKGANVNAKDTKGVTPLMLAAGAKRTEIAELLITKGADVNAKDNKGDTAISYAEGNSDMVTLLRQAGVKGDKLPARVPTKLTAADVNFLKNKCSIAQADIDVISKLEKNVQQKLFSRIARRDCELLKEFKISRHYAGQINKTGPHDKIPMPPAGWNMDYLTPSELEHHTDLMLRKINE
jgi:ankyrin repeat protein